MLLVSGGQVPHLWCWYFAGLQGSHLAYKPQTSAGVMVGLLADFSRGGDLLYELISSGRANWMQCGGVRESRKSSQPVQNKN